MLLMKNLPEIVKDCTLFSSKLSDDKKAMIEEKWLSLP